jgi:pimeloyl-ACP methyl ester carboxylesterase
MTTRFFILILTGSLALKAAAGTPARSEPSSNPRTILAEVGKIVSPNGIDEAKAVEIGGIHQWITVRGRDRRNPILLVLHGGPAAPDLPNRYLFEGPWTDYFTVVEWDQRGAGKTYELNDPKKVAPTTHAVRMVKDTEELVAYLRATYDKEKIFALGHSWGSILGLNLAARKPNWLYAYIGVGQIINMREGERICYEWVLDTARKAGDSSAVKELEGIVPYPEPDGAPPLEKVKSSESGPCITAPWRTVARATAFGRTPRKSRRIIRKLTSRRSTLAARSRYRNFCRTWRRPISRS